MVRMEQTLDGTPLPKHVRMWRAEDSGRIEIVYRKLPASLLFLIPFMCVWSGMSLGGIYVLPILKGKPLELLPCLFGIPFLVVSIAIWSGILAVIFGTRKLTLEYGSGCYSFKLLGIGISRSFDLRRDTEISSGGNETVRPRGVSRRIRVKNGYQSVYVCSFWDEDATDFALEQLRQHCA